ncbi:3-hexulose-6-phosphate synthase [Alicyclobacillus fastidiosus]|uniref:3-hexulose-6-phosphate synthase n=1 Tax=Alicyclobacillus fastidiosus TaxID=392011 RepID=A0ABV5AHT5_9BACL|nr:3-hexulose-6-phosphate synthase [Alicyclobacillus fastidiosus]WEH08879.1 orotidine 5'-phosphate decarboxylase [Alicyclobacillus fastidiosus]
MKIQLALDRVDMDEAIAIASAVSDSVDWIEVGTSLVKEFGMQSIRTMREVFPHKTILADMKTFDNAAYEMKLCFEAGANVATVMGAAPMATIELCKRVADEYGAHVMIDLLNVSADKVDELRRLTGVTWCYHVSKDEQEGQGTSAVSLSLATRPTGVRAAAAGGITVDSIPHFSRLGVDILVVGSAITKARDPREAARYFREVIEENANERELVER